MQQHYKLMKAFSLICTTLMHTGSTQIPTVSNGKLMRHENFQSKYVTQRHVEVWLPPGYDSTEKYAVLYMHDGQMLFDANTTWNKQAWEVGEVMTQLLADQKVRKTIVVGVWNGGSTRHADYFPQKPFNALPNEFKNNLLAEGTRGSGQKLFADTIKSDGYLKFLVEELKPFINGTYPTLPDRENTFIAGSSMGGLISMYALCEYPQVFGGAACLSTHWPGIFSMENNPIPQAFYNYLKANLPSPNTRKLYFDYGTATLDSFYPPLQKEVDHILQSTGWETSHWETLKFEGADHSENAWRERLDKPLLFLLK